MIDLKQFEGHGRGSRDSRSQVSCIGLPPPKSWSDFRNGCHGTYGGGHREEETQNAFHHGMDTVFNLIEYEFPSAELCKSVPDLIDEIERLRSLLDEVRRLSNPSRAEHVDPDQVLDQINALVIDYDAP